MLVCVCVYVCRYYAIYLYPVPPHYAQTIELFFLIASFDFDGHVIDEKWKKGDEKIKKNSL